MTMTYDQARSPPPQGQAGTYEQNDPRYFPSGAYQPSYSNPPVPEHDRYRANEPSNTQQATYDADATGYIQVRQPINDAVASGINATERTNTFSPEMISQLTSHITASVLQQLNAQPPNMQAQPLAAPKQTSPTAPASQPVERNTVQTSPLPYRASEEAAQTPVSPTQTHFLNTSYAQGSPPQHRRPMSPLSQASQADDSDLTEEHGIRPRGPKRIATGEDATIIEKTWGALFTEDGQTTLRLGQFLRGIAVHIIEDYEPKHSLVITPPKLQKYYEDTKLPTELYPWHTVFDDRTSSISRLYREFEAQHHLVQERLDKRPGIPGLTPHGFEKWATTLLRAHPDQEFERLTKTALDMPISNPDDRRERFPKEISRRLFPKDPDTDLVSKLRRAIKEHCGVIFQSRHDSLSDAEQPPLQTSYRSEDPLQPSPITTTFLPPNKRQDSVISPSRTSPPPNYLGVERDRKPYSNAPSDEALSDDGDDVPTPQPIERERKPYIAQPGGGKLYDESDRQSTDFIPPQDFKHTRTMSMNQGQPLDAQRSRPISIAIHQKPPPPPMDGGEVRTHRSNSIYTRDPQGRSGRQRSPSLGANGISYGHRSEGDIAYGSTYPSASADVLDDARRRREREYEFQRERNKTDRYDPARIAAYDPRERERERDPRPRVQSTTGPDGRPVYATDDAYFPAGGNYPPTRDPHQQYPPSSYR